MTSVQILSEVHRRGIELQAAGDKLRLRPSRDVPPDLLSAIRIHRAELLELLGLPEDIDPPGVAVDKLEKAETDFSCLDTVPLNVVLCVVDPDQPEHWVAYRRPDRNRQGRGDSQAEAVLALARGTNL